MKTKLLKSWLMLVMLLVGVGTGWAEDIKLTREWKVTSFSDLKLGDIVVISNNFNNALKSNQTVTKSAANIDVTSTPVSEKTDVYTLTYQGATNLNDLAWTVDNGTNGKKFYVYGSSTNLLYLAKTGDNNALGIGAGTSNTEWVMGSAGKLLLNYGNGRYCGKYVSGSDWRTYNTETATNYKSGSTEQTLIFYVLQEDSGEDIDTPETTKYNVNIATDITNGTVTADPTSAVEGATVTLTATPAAGYEFGSWNVIDVSSNAITITDGKFIMPASDVNVSATFNQIKGDVFKKTELSEIGANDDVIITMSKGNDTKTFTYAMSNNNGTTSAPSATEVTVTDNQIITSNEAILWNLAYDNESSTFVAYPKGVTDIWLYCTNTNNGVRVGTGTAKNFQIKDGYLYESGTTDARYLGVYNSEDIRCYTSINSNISGQTLAFYVKSNNVTDPEEPADDPQISNFINTPILSLETGAEPYDVSTLLNIPEDYDTNTYAITTTINGLTQKDGEYACVYPYLSFQKAGTYTVKVTAAAIEGKYAETSGTITVTVTEPVTPRPENEIFYESFDTNEGTGGNDNQWSGSIASNKISSDNEGWVFENEGGANKCAKLGAGSKLGTATTPALGQACNATLTFKAAAWNGSSESTTLKLSVVEGGTVSPATVTLKKGEWTEYTVTLTGLTADSKIKFEGNAASNSRFFLDEVSVVKTGEASVVVSSITVKTAPTKLEYTEGDSFDPTGLVITANYSNESAEDVVYAEHVSDFTFSPSLTDALATTNTIVTITYGGKTATQAITVNAAASIGNTQETAYTVAEAIALIDAGKGLSTPVYVKGTVSEIVTPWSDQYNNITYNISADGTTEGNQFQLYRCVTNGAEVGDNIIAYGTLKKYNSTYEFEAGNNIVSLIKPEVTKYNVIISGDIEHGTVTANPATAAAGETVTLTVTPGNGYSCAQLMVYTDYDDIEVVDNKFVMPAADVEVYAYFAPASSETYTLSEFVANAEDIEPGSMVSVSFNNEVVEIVNDEELAMIGLKDGDNTFTLIAETQFSSDWAVGGTLAGTWSAMYYGQNPMNGAYMLYYVDADDPWAGLTYTAPAAPVYGTINFVANNEDGYWATFSSDKDVIFDANDVIVYTVAVDGKSLVMVDADSNSLSCVTDKTKNEGWVAGYYVQAGAGVLINSLEESVNYYYIDTDPYTSNDLNEIETDPEYNMLRPASVAKEATGYKFYKLAYSDSSMKPESLGFYWGAANGGVFESRAGGAYLAVPSNVALAAGFSFVDDDNTTTGINEIRNTADAKAIYNLNGQRVNASAKGIMIKGGRKFINK